MKARKSPIPPAVANMIHLGTEEIIFPLTPEILMIKKIQPSMKTAARASW
jgi:hypothetical protein